MAYQTPYGMHDILPEEQPYWEAIRAAFARVCAAYGFGRLDTPIMEHTAVFLKGMGEGTDIVDKEMYSFVDKGGDRLTLRPEFTAGVVRAFIEQGMKNRPQPVKLASIGPIFRRDRPGAGRYRQFHQINAEIIGVEDPAADAELIALALRFGRELGLDDLEVLLNSTGCPACKPPYIAALVAYLQMHAAELAALDRERIARNPLRVLDSKELETQEALAGAPRLADGLCDACRAHHAEVTRLLGAMALAYREAPLLVRGLDYYTRTVFEIVSVRAAGVGTLMGGGRYDGLAEMLDGPATPGVGFGGGMERMILVLREGETASRRPDAPDVLVAYIGAGCKDHAFVLAEELRNAGVPTVFALGDRGLKSQMKLAGKLGARLAVIAGEGELAAGMVQLRDMQASSQEPVTLGEVVAVCARRIRGST